MLKVEVETYEENRAELIDKSIGKYVLIKDNKIVGIYDTENDAVREGYTRFGNVPFLARRIEAIETVENFTSNLIFQ